jgi:hypothetical protein
LAEVIFSQRRHRSNDQYVSFTGIDQERIWPYFEKILSKKRKLWNVYLYLSIYAIADEIMGDL